MEPLPLGPGERAQLHRSDPANVRNSAARTRRMCKNSDAPPFRLVRRKKKKQQLIRRPRGARLRPGPKAPPPPPPPWASNPSPAADPFAPAPRRPSPQPGPPHCHSDGQGWQGRGVARVAGRQNVATPAGSRVAKKMTRSLFESKNHNSHHTIGLEP